VTTCAVQEGIWLHQSLNQFCIDCPCPLVLSTDNNGVKSLSVNDSNHGKAKHIDIRYHFIRSHIESRSFVVKHTPSVENTADIFTKPLSHIIFQSHVARLRLSACWGGLLAFEHLSILSFLFFLSSLCHLSLSRVSPLPLFTSLSVCSCIDSIDKDSFRSSLPQLFMLIWTSLRCVILFLHYAVFCISFASYYLDHIVIGNNKKLFTLIWTSLRSRRYRTRTLIYSSRQEITYSISRSRLVTQLLHHSSLSVYPIGLNDVAFEYSDNSAGCSRIFFDVLCLDHYSKLRDGNTWLFLVWRHHSNSCSVEYIQSFL